MLTRRQFLAALSASPLAHGAFASKALAHAGHGVQQVDIGGGRQVSYVLRRAGTGPAPLLLGFGGGDANRGIVSYYNAIYSPRSVYRDHHVVLPIGEPGRLFYQYSDTEIRDFLRALTAAEPIAGRGIVSGVSNGGRAAFRFAAAAPDAFRAILTMPGALVGDPIPAEWRDYAVLLAHGSADARWKAESDRAVSALQGRVGVLERVELAGQGHVIDPGFAIDPVYARLREMERRLSRG